MLLKNIICIISFFCLSFTVFGQSGFKAKAFTGFTLSQVQGDRLAGFDKLGLNAGLAVQFAIREKIHLGLEFGYTQKGSRGNLIFNVPTNKYITHLQYFELPIFIEVKDWPIDDYFRIGIHTGLAGSYLYQGTSSIIDLDDNLVESSQFTRTEISFLLGATYAFTKRLQLLIRYSRGLNKFYKSPNVNTGGLLNYNWTVRAEFLF